MPFPLREQTAQLGAAGLAFGQKGLAHQAFVVVGVQHGHVFQQKVAGTVGDGHRIVYLLGEADVLHLAPQGGHVTRHQGLSGVLTVVAGGLHQVALRHQQVDAVGVVKIAFGRKTVHQLLQLFHLSGQVLTAVYTQHMHLLGFFVHHCP